ncbi:hypothetical protein BDZ91DRAFT_847092 [Kalaharituber pfeilii]|nr:hypothetical protein BDZ91DRAFT_847092 [Kalaharituber pfeilii]
MASVPSSYPIGSIIDIYNFDSTTGVGLGVGSPARGTARLGSEAIRRAQSKLAAILQTYFYNISPSPWTPPAVYLSLHRSLEALEDALYQTDQCRTGVQEGILGLLTNGLFDLLQAIELLLMSSRVDGPRNEKWWDRFAKELHELDNSGQGNAFQEARENVDYFTWVTRWILRVSVHGEYTRRITVAGDKLEKMLVKLCDSQLELYKWDGADGEEPFDMTKRFSEMATYQGDLFLRQVKLEAVLRVWIFWVYKSTIALQHIQITQRVSPKVYLNLLKAGWLFKQLRADNRLEHCSDELRAVVSLLCNELVLTFKILLEQWLPNPDLTELISEGDWNILLDDGFEDWELLVEAKEFADARATITTKLVVQLEESPIVPSIQGLAFEDETGTDLDGMNSDSDFAPDFHYSPIIMREDDYSDEEGDSIDLKTPMLPNGQGSMDNDTASERSLNSSHTSLSSLYSVYSTSDSISSVTTVEDDEIEPKEPGSPDIKLMMSPAAVPQSAYETYEPLETFTGHYEENLRPHNVPQPTEGMRSKEPMHTREIHEGGEVPRPWADSPSSGSPGLSGHSRTPNGSRFREHLSQELSYKPLPDIPGISIGHDSSQKPKEPITDALPDTFLPPVPVKGPNSLLAPVGRLAPSGLSATRSVKRIPVGGTMSSAGGRDSAVPVLPTRASTIAYHKTHTSEASQKPAGTQHTPTGIPPGLGVKTAAKEGPRAIPAPLQLSKKPTKLEKALRTARGEGGWSNLLMPGHGSGIRDKDGGDSQIAGPTSSCPLSSKRVHESPQYPKTPVPPLTVVSGEVIAVNKEIRPSIDKSSISCPTPAGLPAISVDNSSLENSSVIDPEASKAPLQKKSTKRGHKRSNKSIAARTAAMEKRSEYEPQPGEIEILGEELWGTNALASDTGLPSGRWDECVIRIFKRRGGGFRVVTFRDGKVNEDWVDPLQAELVLEYAHHMHETVPIIFVRKMNEKKAPENEEEGKLRRESTRSSFACVGDGDEKPRLGNAETFYYRFRRLDDMFNFQLAWLGEIVLTDIPAVKSIRYKKGFVGGEFATARARVQIWKESPGFHESGHVISSKVHRGRGRPIKTRIVMFWDEMICTTFINENIDIEAKPKSKTLRLKAVSHRPAFNPSVRAKLFGQSFITTPATLVPGQLSTINSGGVALDNSKPGGFSDEDAFDDFKWFEIEFYDETEMKWFYQDFMRCLKDRLREMRVIGGGETAAESSRERHGRN